MSIRPIGEDDLHGFVDGFLSDDRRGEVERYLAAHPDAARRVAGYSAQREALAAALAPIVEEPVPSALNPAHIVAARRRGRVPAWQAVAAGLLLAALGAAGGWLARGTVTPAGGVAALAREAADSYAVFAPDLVRPVEIRASDSATLVTWTSRRLGHQVAVPDLTRSGFRLIGGRLVATPHGPAAMLMYDDAAGMRIAVLTRSMEADRDAPMASRAAGPVADVTWSANGIGYSLVGAAPAAALHPIADEVRRQVGGGA